MSQGIFTHWPNRITALRLVGAVMLFALFSAYGEIEPSENRRILAICFWLFVVTAVTDILDGYLARRGNHVTAFGRIADPFVDKILVLGTMIFLSVMDWSRVWFPAWIVVVILSREVLVTAIRGYVESVGGELPADWFGKIKMTAQCFAIGTALATVAFAWSIGWIVEILVWLTLITSVGSGLSYVLKSRKTFMVDAR